MKDGDFGSSPRASRIWRTATFNTASQTNVPGQIALRSSSFVTSWPGRPSRYSSHAKGFGLRFIVFEPVDNRSLARSRQKRSNKIRFSFDTVDTEEYRFRLGMAIQARACNNLRHCRFPFALRLPKRYRTLTTGL